MGVDVVRIPVDVFSLLGSAPEYKIDPKFFILFNKVIRWSEAAGVKIILDNHTFHPTIGITKDVEKWLILAWKQFAEIYKNQHDHVLFEVLNEPHGISDADWNAVQLNVVTANREIDANRWLIIGGSGYNGISNLHQMPVYPFDNLIYTFHFYEPFLFTHQGASWTGPSMEAVTQIPFPYDVNRMPAVPNVVKGTWIESSYQSYNSAGTKQKMAEIFQSAINFKNSRNVSVYCGEFGVYNKNAPNEDRNHWYSVATKLLTDAGIAWTAWDYRGGFGMFLPNSSERFNYDFNVDMADSLGLTPPVQLLDENTPLSGDQVLFQDYLFKGLSSDVNKSGCYISYLHQENSSDEAFSMLMTNIGQYGYMGITFKANHDFTVLSIQLAVLEFDLRVSGNVNQFEVRFENPDNYPEVIPWRKRTILTKSIYFPDSQWRKISIPLSEMSESGAWVNSKQLWLDAKGEFSWETINRLLFVAESEDLKGDSVLVKNLIIRVPTETSISESEQPQKIILFDAFPNPFNPTTSISFHTGKSTIISLRVFDVLGKEIAVLIDKTNFEARNHDVRFDAPHLSSGMYFFRLQTSEVNLVKKMILMK
ncbi:MAG: cellulase family glycosylhydrolase [Bacteroidetes bacterium]|nr:cellulase family glycosylhydrolase [Bacteroidota bacterium]